MPDASANQPILAARQLSKSFGDVQVLNNIDLNIHGGEVLALLGENGAGKSTLVKLLAGFEPITSGTLNLLNSDGSRRNAGKDWDIRTAERQGVVLIHQELNLAEQLNATDNIFLGNELKHGLLLNERLMHRRAREYLDSLNCDIDPREQVSGLEVSIKQMIEIAKAYAKQSRVLILDEPTAVLTFKESEVLFALINKLKREGVAIVYISHKLDEIENIADRVVILRDGDLIGTYQSRELDKDDMARLMVGRELTTLFPTIPKPPDSAKIVLKLTGGSLPKLISRAAFQLCSGEVLGFFGLVGSGRTALMEAIVGLRKLSSTSKLEVNGREVNYKSLATARDDGVAYLTKDRKSSGLLLNMGLRFNFSLFSLNKFSRFLIDQKREQQEFDNAIKIFDIRAGDLEIKVGNLSGGNQQKLLFAKIMAADPSIVIIDEPTRGIDIGTRSEIYRYIAELADNGHAIILVSSDMLEVIGLSHRVAVMCRGELVGILEGGEIEEHEIMRYATGLKSKLMKDGEPRCD